MSLLDSFKPKWKHSDPNVRREAIEKVTEQKILYKIVFNDENADVRKAAFEKITDQDVLSAIARNDENADVRKAAIEKVTDQDVLSEIAKYDENEDVRKAAFEKVTNKKPLYKIIAQYNKNADVRKAAVKKVTNKKVLSEIAKYDENVDVRKAAIEKVTDQDVLSVIARNDENEDVRKAAVRRTRAADVRKATVKKQKAAVKKQEALADIEQATLESSEKIRFRGVMVPVIKDMNVFSRIVKKKSIPIGLLVRMDDFTLTYGKLLNSVPNHETIRINPFNVHAENGPCRLFCSKCKKLLPGSFIFGLDAAREFRGGVGGGNLKAGLAGACPKCGGNNSVIVFNPKETA
jgi:hypothetical protein